MQTRFPLPRPGAWPHRGGGNAPRTASLSRRATARPAADSQGTPVLTGARLRHESVLHSALTFRPVALRRARMSSRAETHGPRNLRSREPPARNAVKAAKDTKRTGGSSMQRKKSSGREQRSGKK
ncbi:hypothetical protein TRVL_06320 [Trypanosoma vivax]|nr:hypothetical protein TRVL_06320 [Trypanosoma vivax]